MELEFLDFYYKPVKPTVLLSSRGEIRDMLVNLKTQEPCMMSSPVSVDQIKMKLKLLLWSKLTVATSSSMTLGSGELIITEVVSLKTSPIQLTLVSKLMETALLDTVLLANTPWATCLNGTEIMESLTSTSPSIHMMLIRAMPMQDLLGTRSLTL